MTIHRILKPDYANKIALVQFKPRGNVISVKWIPMDWVRGEILKRFQK